MAHDIAIADLLTQEGFDTLPAFQTAREVLISKGLTNARKTDIHVTVVIVGRAGQPSLQGRISGGPTW